MTRPTLKRGRANGPFYAKLRCQAARIIDDLQRKTLPSRVAAARLGLARSTYERLRRFVADHQDLVASALKSGDWSSIEEILFAGVPQYRNFPSYIAALVKAGAASEVKGRHAQRGRPRKPGNERKTTPARKRKTKKPRSRLRRLWRKITRLFGRTR
jgi:hypothetical protein